MSPEPLALRLGAFLATYAVHSTLVLGTLALFLRRREGRPTTRERLWRFGLVAGLATTTAQTALGWTPLIGRLALQDTAPQAELAREALLEPGTLATGSLSAPPPWNLSEPVGSTPDSTSASASPPASPGSAPASRSRSATPRRAPARSDARDHRNLDERAAPAPLHTARTAALDEQEASPAEAVARRAPLDSTETPRSAPSVPAWPEPQRLVEPARGATHTVDPPEAFAPASPASDARSTTNSALPASLQAAPVGWLAALRTPLGIVRGLVWVWGALAALAWIAFGLRTLAVQLTLRDRRPLNRGPLAGMLSELCRRANVRGRVRLSTSDKLGSPVAFGFVRREICLPVRALTELAEDEQECMLAHELAHAVRCDPLWFSAFHLLERVFFFQPLNRLAHRELRDAAELACDDQAVRWTGRRIALASTLTEIAGWLVAPPPRSVPVASMAARPSRLAVRVERLLVDDARFEQRRSWLVLPLGGLALASVAAAAPGVGLAVVHSTGANDTEAATSPAARVWALPASDPTAALGAPDARLGQQPARAARPEALPARARDPRPRPFPALQRAPELAQEPALGRAEVRGVLGTPDDTLERSRLRNELERFRAELAALDTESLALREELRELPLPASLQSTVDEIERRLDALRAQARSVEATLADAPSP